MITAWTKHLKTDEEKDRFRNKVNSAKVVLQRLIELLDEEEDSLDRSELSQMAYDNANWPYLQAHKNGYRQALSIVKKIITLDQEHK